MIITKYIAQLGILFIAYSIIWALFAFPLLLILLKLDLGKLKWLLKLIGGFILVATTAYFCNITTQDLGVISSILCVFIGWFVLFLSFLKNTYDDRLLAEKNNDFFAIEESIKYDSKITLLSLSLFLILIFVPSLANNYFSKLFYGFINGIFDIKITGTIFLLLGLIVVLYIVKRGVVYGIFTMVQTISFITRFFSRKVNNKLVENIEINKSSIQDVTLNKEDDII